MCDRGLVLYGFIAPFVLCEKGVRRGGPSFLPPLQREATYVCRDGVGLRHVFCAYSGGA